MSTAALLRRLPTALTTTMAQRGFCSTRASAVPAAIGLSDVKYTAVAKGVGGRNGKVEVLGEEPGLKLDLALPKALGGDGQGQNPEQLFSLGYTACFIGAMGVAARQFGVKLPAEVSVETHTSIGTPAGGEGFGIGLKVIVNGAGSGIGQTDLEKVVREGHKNCPYSKATRNNIEVEFEVKA